MFQFRLIDGLDQQSGVLVVLFQGGESVVVGERGEDLRHVWRWGNHWWERGVCAEIRKTQGRRRLEV